MNTRQAKAPASTPVRDQGQTRDPSQVQDLNAVRTLLSRPFLELVFEAATIHRKHHDPRAIQCSELLSIKTGGCSEDCGYCSQSAHFETQTPREQLMQVEEVVTAAQRAKANGADRFCMGTAWRGARDGEEFDRVCEMVSRVKDLGLETCVTLGMLQGEQAKQLEEAGLDFYNHNLDTGRSHYAKVTTTHTFDDRLDTIRAAQDAGLRICAGGILGMGEDRDVRAELLCELAGLDPAPESVPINTLVPVSGTKLQDAPSLDWSELVRTVATARILMPKAYVRLSAGRAELTEEAQAMCFLAGANSIFVGDKLLTTPNPEPGTDAALLEKLGLQPVQRTQDR